MYCIDTVYLKDNPGTMYEINGNITILVIGREITTLFTSRKRRDTNAKAEV